MCRLIVKAQIYRVLQALFLPRRLSLIILPKQTLVYRVVAHLTRNQSPSFCQHLYALCEVDSHLIGTAVLDGQPEFPDQPDYDGIFKVVGGE